MKITISVLNFVTESAEKATIYNLIFLIPIHLAKNNNKYSFEIRN